MRVNVLTAAVLSLPLSRLVYCYLAARAVLWAAVLHLTQPAKPLDVLEHLAWAREFQLVYEHHPGAVSWIVGALDTLGGGDSFLLSLPAPVFVSLAMLSVWHLARRMTDARYALVAMLSLEGVWYFGVVAAEFNHNILQLAAWAFVILMTHRAFLSGGHHHAPMHNWILLGIAAAFSLYAKYSSALLLAVLFLWSISDKTARRQYRQSGVYLAFAVFSLLTLPQVIALSSLDFSPFRFAVSRAEDASSAGHHFLYPIKFLLAQCGAVLLAVILCRLAIQKTTTNIITTNAADRRFVLTAAFAPLLLALCISALGGWRFKSHWGAPMLSFIPLAILLIAQGRGYAPNLRRFIKSAMAVAGLSVVVIIAINTASPFIKERGKRIHYPGEQIGAAVDALWQKQNANFAPDDNTRFASDTIKPLSAVVGSMHLASLVSFYAPSRPRAVINGDWRLSYGVSKAQFQKTGGIIIWTINDGKTQNAKMPDYAKAYPAKEYPKNTTPATITLNWQTPANIPPLILGIITIPPTSE